LPPVRVDQKKKGPESFSDPAPWGSRSFRSGYTGPVLPVSTVFGFGAGWLKAEVEMQPCSDQLLAAEREYTCASRVSFPVRVSSVCIRNVIVDCLVGF
jgi:hypothetical protein